MKPIYVLAGVAVLGAGGAAWWFLTRNPTSGPGVSSRNVSTKRQDCMRKGFTSSECAQAGDNPDVAQLIKMGRAEAGKACASFSLPPQLCDAAAGLIAEYGDDAAKAAWSAGGDAVDWAWKTSGDIVDSTVDFLKFW